MEPAKDPGPTVATAPAPTGAQPAPPLVTAIRSPGGVVLLTLAAGILAGLVLAAIVPPPSFPGPGPGPRFPRFESHSDVDVILSTVSLALLAALLAVYVRTYRQTQANFALGLIVVLIALLVPSLVSSPVVIGAFGHPLGLLGSFFLVADIFKSAAFAVFLYLSLQ